MSNGFGELLGGGVVLADEFVWRDAVVGAVGEVDGYGVGEIDDRGPEVELEVVGVAVGADLVAQHFGGWAERVQTPVLGGALVVAVEAAWAGAGKRPPGGVVGGVPVGVQFHAVMARAAVAAARTSG